MRVATATAKWILLQWRSIRTRMSLDYLWRSIRDYLWRSIRDCLCRLRLCHLRLC